jgi:hypothetical protein
LTLGLSLTLALPLPLGGCALWLLGHERGRENDRG